MWQGKQARLSVLVVLHAVALSTVNSRFIPYYPLE